MTYMLCGGMTATQRWCCRDFEISLRLLLLTILYDKVPPCGKWFDGHSVWQISSVFVFPVLGKVLGTFLWRRGRPRYKFAFGLGIDSERSQFTELFALIEAGTVKVVLDGGSPRSFTTEEVRAAFKLQESGHAHGKVVVQIAE